MRKNDEEVESGRDNEREKEKGERESSIDAQWREKSISEKEETCLVSVRVCVSVCVSVCVCVCVRFEREMDIPTRAS